MYLGCISYLDRVVSAHIYYIEKKNKYILFTAKLKLCENLFEKLYTTTTHTKVVFIFCIGVRILRNENPKIESVERE